MTDLQKNSFEEIKSILEHISNNDMMLRYKKAVPFVDVPVELFEQWKSAFIHSKKWFSDIFTKKEFSLILDFNCQLNWFFDKENTPDVPEIFNLKSWDDLSRMAETTLKYLEKKNEEE